MNASELRAQIETAIRHQGFRIKAGVVLPPKNLSKDTVRRLHRTSVEHRRERSKEGLFRKERELLNWFASGGDINPERICPRIIEVLPDSHEELVFRYASIHWSIPVSSGYGRRLRFLVVDEQNEKLIGIIGLGDPVYSLAARDNWIGWTDRDRKTHLKNVMDAFALGAVPPYSFLLCGKLVAMLAASDEVRHVFRKKYAGVRSRISGKRHDGRLALITTASALGRSSIYNRLRLNQRLLYLRVGFTKASGEFHFSNGLYAAISEFANLHCEPTAKKASWGNGFRSRREVLKKALPALGIPSNWLYHGIERELFVVPLAANARQFLQRRHSRLFWFHQSAAQLFEYFRARWLIPRATRDKRYKDWSREAFALWTREAAFNV
jgi:Druantia protein DruA